jgi:bacterial/archaeal transporter family-2 protein
MGKELVYGLAFIAGIVIAVQASINAKLGVVLDNRMHAVFASFTIGTIGALIYVLVEGTTPKTEAVSSAPWWVWIGGLLGLGFVWATIFAVPKIGVTMMFPLIVAGQMVAAIVVEHFGWMDTPKSPVNLGRLAGVCLVVLGVVAFAYSREPSEG